MYISEKYFKTTSDYFKFLLKEAVLYDAWGEDLCKIDKHENFKIQIGVHAYDGVFDSFYVEKHEGILYSFDADAVDFLEIKVNLCSSIIEALQIISQEFAKDLSDFREKEIKIT